jgi:hypothetical protein
MVKGAIGNPVLPSLLPVMCQQVGFFHDSCKDTYSAVDLSVRIDGR